MAGSLAGVATLTGLTGWFVSRRERNLDRRLAATAEKVRMLELRLDEADEELAVRLNEVDQEVEHLRPARGTTDETSGPVR
jgi:hypothetical protein